jgi:hypothetical protein
MKIYQNIIVFVAITLLCTHFLFVTNYITDGQFSPGWFNNITGRYVLPVFHQNMKIFAPNPPTFSRKIVFRLHFLNGEKSKWKILGTDYLHNSYSNRFSSDLYKYRAIASLSQAIHDEIISEAGLSIDSSKYFPLISKFIKSELEKKLNIDSIAEIQCALLIKNTVPFNERNNKDFEKVMEAYMFPVITLKE